MDNNPSMLGLMNSCSRLRNFYPPEGNGCPQVRNCVWYFVAEKVSISVCVCFIGTHWLLFEQCWGLGGTQFCWDVDLHTMDIYTISASASLLSAFLCSSKQLECVVAS